MASVFSRIASGEIPGHFVAENEDFFAILDISPLRMGHVLVIPRQECDYIFDLDPDTIARYFKFVQQVARTIRTCVTCKRVGVAVIGLEVPHAHVHLVPMDSMDDINFSRPKLNPSTEDLKKVAALLREAFSANARDFA